MTAQPTCRRACGTERRTLISQPRVHFALACGGTRLIANGAAFGGESVWNQHKAEIDENTGPNGSFGAGGGGVSGTFPIPAYQSNSNVPTSLNPAGFRGRGLPDVGPCQRL
jgi:kumamolisin